MDRTAIEQADRLAKEIDGLAHPVRLRVMLTMDTRAASPTMLASALDIPLATVSYHVRCLAGAGLLRMVSRRPRRGALEHLYALTERGRVMRGLALDVLRTEPPR